VSFVSDDAGGNYVPGTGVWSIGTLLNGASASLNITATVDAGTANSSITNTTTPATGDQDDNSTGGDDLNETITVANNADLVTVKSVNNANPQEGDTIVYTLTVTNNGAATATNVSLIDTLPAGVSFVSDDAGGNYVPGTGVWSIGTLLNGASASLNITATVDAGTANSSITNTTTPATGDQDDNSTGGDDLNETITVGINPNISVTKVATFIDSNADGYANIGEKIRYDFNVTNTGNVNLLNIRLTDNNAIITGGPIAILSIGQSDTVTFSGEHIITLQDLIDGRIINQAIVEGTPPVGPDINASSDDPTTGPIDDPTIIPLNIEPPIATDNNQSVSSGEDAVIDVVGDDLSGAFALDPTTVKLTPPPGATNIIYDPDGNGDIVGFDVPNEGTWSVNLITGEVTFSPNSDYVGDPTPIQYTVEDTQGNATSATIRLNYPPVAHDDSNMNLTVGDTAIFNPLLNDQQTSTPFDPTTINLIVPIGATGTDTDGDGDIDEVVVPGEGVWTAEADGTVIFVPETTLIGDPTPLKYTVRETDGDLSNEATLNVSYRSGSGVPDAVDDGIIPIRQYGPNVIDVLINDTFGPDGPGTQEIIIIRAPAYGTVFLDDGGTPNDPTDDVLVYEPEPNIPPVTDSFEYMITDANGDTSTATVTLDVNCASTQTSDGNTFGIIGFLMMMLMMISTGLYFVKKEEGNR
jgi:uncharacterized repeat protein (TIGR01451 family)